MKNDVLIVGSIIYLLLLQVKTGVFAKNDLEIVFFDVGQGDAVFISTSKGSKVLIDGGDNFEADYKISKLIPFYSCYLDLIILTHPHSDHIKSLYKVMQRCDIGSVMFNDVDYPSNDFSFFKDVAKRFRVKNAYSGDRFVIDGVEFFILWPDKDYLKKSFADINDVSIVLLMSYKGSNFLFTGDATENVLEFVSKKLSDISFDGTIDVIKVPHHGSKYSLHKSFYSKIQSKECVISVGENNKFGHPFEDVLKYFEDIDCRVLRTDKLGDIKFIIK